MDAVEEQISKIETLAMELKDSARRDILRADSLLRMAHQLKNGESEPEEKIIDWKKEVESWRQKKPSNSMAR